MKNITLIVLFVLGKVGLAQSFEIVGRDTINFVDENNLRQGFWIILNKVKKLPGYKEDAKVEEGTYRDSKKTGLWKQFFPSGRLKNEITYANNRPSGYARMYYENGNIMEEGVWENNRWVGTYKQYYESGKIYYDWNYNNQGKREGEQKYYYENGKLMIEGKWQDGKENGVIKEYYENGALKAERVFNDGTIDLAASKEYTEKGVAHALDGVSLPTASDTKSENKPQGSVTKQPEIIKEQPKTPEVKVGSETEVPPVVNTEKITVGADGLGTVPDGYNKLYNSRRLIDKEGIFKDGKLWDGKQFEYTGNEVTRIKIIKEGKVHEILKTKEEIEKFLKK